MYVYVFIRYTYQRLFEATIAHLRLDKAPVRKISCTDQPQWNFQQMSFTNTPRIRSSLSKATTVSTADDSRESSRLNSVSDANGAGRNSLEAASANHSEGGSESGKTNAGADADDNDGEHGNEGENRSCSTDNKNAGAENDNAGEHDGGALERTVSATSQREPDRKRKDNINQKITELLELIPPSFFADLGEKNTGTKDGKPNKGQILSKSVDYISWLQNEIDNRNRKEVELTMLLNNTTNAPNHNTHTVAEQMLAKIGVGPLAE